MKDEKFGDEKKIIGMIHLAGKDKIKQALKEIDIYERYGLYGALIENYHGNTYDIKACLEAITRTRHIHLGINILPNNYLDALMLADDYGLSFIQSDVVAGKYWNSDFDGTRFKQYKERFPNIKVYGGVWPKYYVPIRWSVLEDDLHDAMQRCDSIVVTGEGTGIETPLEKIRRFRNIIGDKELIIGAGLNYQNAREQLSIADGAIIGSYFKNGETRNPVDPQRVKEMMEIARGI